MKVVNLENDCFLVSFSEKEDYIFALYEGPWIIAEHYPVVQRGDWNLIHSMINSRKLHFGFESLGF